MLRELYHFFRISALGATATLPLLGAASVDRRLSPQRAAGLLAVAAAFHAFAYVHNDVCDLALDQTQPRRSMYPLVRGTLTPHTALAVALACVPLAFLLDHLLVATTDDRRPTIDDRRPPTDDRRPTTDDRRPTTDDRRPTTARPSAIGYRLSAIGYHRRRHLATAFALLALYNRWGKACPFPPLTDALQGLGWAALLRYGAASAGPTTGLTRLLGTYELLLIMMVNGLHGALRDLENDAAHGARTTAILFGARVGAGAELRVSPALVGYALALQALLLALPAWAVATNMAGHERRERHAAAVWVGAVSAATLAVLVAAVRGGRTTEPGMAHLVLMLSAPVALVGPGLPPATGAMLLAAHLLPLLPNSLTYDALHWALGSALTPSPSPLEGEGVGGEGRERTMLQ